jgi:hypothetical protein
LYGDDDGECDDGEDFMASALVTSGIILRNISNMRPGDNSDNDDGREQRAEVEGTKQRADTRSRDQEAEIREQITDSRKQKAESK